MTLTNLLAITANPFLSAAIWALVILFILYLARGPVHRALGALGNIVYRAMRLLAASALGAEKKLAQRNRRVLLAFGRAHTRRMLARQFSRIHSMTASHLEGHPRIQRQLSEVIARLEKDYAESSNVPPCLPDWIPAIKTIADIDRGADTLVAKMLQEIRRSLEGQQKTAVETYRQATAERHRILTRWMPLWRQIRRQLQRSGKSVAKLSTQAETIDRYMAEFEAVEHRAEQIEDMLRADTWKQFSLSAVMLAILFGSGFLNYHILSAAIGPITAAAGRFGLFTAAQTAALVLVLTEIGLGVFLTEALGMTHTFPGIGSMDEQLRRWFVWIPLTLLLVFAGLQSLLIYLAPGIGAAALQPADLGSSRHALAVIGPAVLGAVLPLVLSLTAIPLETFAATTRSVSGLLARGILTGLAVFFRLIGSLACAAARLLATCYDIIIFPAIWLEDIVRTGRASSAAAADPNLPGAQAALQKAASESSES